MASVCGHNSKILLAITNCTFLQEKAGLVGAIYIDGEDSTISLTVLIKKNTIFRKCTFVFLLASNFQWNTLTFIHRLST